MQLGPIHDLSGLGTLRALPDWMIVKIFSTFSKRELCAISLTSKAFFVFAENDQMWKKKCLRRFEGDFTFKGTWKRTVLLGRDRKVDREPITIALSEKLSPLLYKKWKRAHVPIASLSALPKDLPKTHSVDRRSNLSLQEFIDEYGKPNKPVILTDVVTKWKAFTEKVWSREQLCERFSTIPFRTDQPAPRGDKMHMSIADYFIYADSIRDEDPMYLFDPHFADKMPELLQDYDIPIYFKQDFFNYLTEDDHPYYRWIVIGPPGSGSPFHIDPYLTAAWNGLISGRKRWALYPPHMTPPGCIQKQGKLSLRKTPIPIKWFVDHYPQAVNTPQAPIECILQPGEIIFVPTGWYHLVLNLDMCIAVTQNFCNAQNFPYVYEDLASSKRVHAKFTDKMLLHQRDLMIQTGAKIPEYYWQWKRKKLTKHCSGEELAEALKQLDDLRHQSDQWATGRRRIAELGHLVS